MLEQIFYLLRADPLQFLIEPSDRQPHHIRVRTIDSADMRGKTSLNAVCTRLVHRLAAVYIRLDLRIAHRIYIHPRLNRKAALPILSQDRHARVYTGVAILTEDRESCFAVETRVDVYPMSDAEIEAYVDCGESMDKAGAYGIQGSFAAHIRGIDGSYTNVMGLPVGRLYQELKRICPEKIEDLLKHTV